ncbi:hypothetical protein HKD37_15G043463 [Glycine soja]
MRRFRHDIKIHNGENARNCVANMILKFYDDPTVNRLEIVVFLRLSVSIKYFKDPKETLLNTHFTIQILKVMQPRQFGSNWNEIKKISWWDFFGPIPKIFPEQVQQGFAQFNKHFNSQESQILADLKYFSSFTLSWIFSWQYRYSKIENNKQFSSLQRHGFVKWWNQFDTSKAQLDKVKIWFKTHLEFLKAPDPETSLFLNQKSQLAAFLARSNSKEHLTKKLKEPRRREFPSLEEGSSSSKKEDTNSSNHDNDFYQNEDDCFGKKIGFLSSVIVVVLIVEPEISSKWSWLNSVVITTSIVSTTTTTNVSRSFAIRWKAELEHTWHLLDNSGNMHSIAYNQDLVSSTLLAGWTELRDFYGLTKNHQVTLTHFGQSVFFKSPFLIDRSAELLSNLKCRTLADFRWYRDTFLTRVYKREDSQQPFWKEKFLAGLPRSLGDKVRDKIRSQSANGDIPYESLSYGQLISYVQKVALKIFQDDKIQRQLAKEKAQTKRDLGSFCEQFGLPPCPKQKKKQSSKKEIHENKPVNTKRFPRRRYSHKPSTSRGMENPKQKTKSKITCYNCGKQGHISKYCRLKKKLRNLNLEPAIEEQINNLLIETSEEETETSSSVLSDENLNLIQQDDQLSSTDDDDGQINTLTREQDLLFEAINSIPDPQEKKVFLEKLKKTLEVKPRQKDFITNNKFDKQWPYLIQGLIQTAF